MRKGPVSSYLGALLGAAVLILAALPVSPAAERDKLVVDGPAPDLILLYTGDVIGYVGPCG